MLVGQLFNEVKTREGLLEQLGVDHAVLADKAFALFGVLRTGKEDRVVHWHARQWCRQAAGFLSSNNHSSRLGKSSAWAMGQNRRAHQ